ncbi:MAG TPA: Sec-independent protein translocase protein TatB [Candidatus Binatia bacterium]|nr:Sec-independent protein translocase protein TatB [Candidatus Binatia bacterium]
MFEVGFSELLLCFLVALVVLGPDKLPRVASAVGRWTGAARGYLRRLHAELERETQVGEVQKQLQDAQRALREQAGSVDAAVRKAADDLKR